MERKFKELDYNITQLETYGVIPFTLKKDSLEDLTIWSANPKFYDENVDSIQRINKFLGKVQRVGINDVIQPHQRNLIETCHELTTDEALGYYSDKIYAEEGSIWNIEKRYDAIFMSRETHFSIYESTGRSLSLAFPAADCAIIRIYDKKNDIIGITHSGVAHTTKKIINSTVSYMQTHFNSSLEDLVVFVGAFAYTGMIWDKYPPFAEEHPEIWKDYIVELNEEEKEKLKKTREVLKDKKYYDIKFGDRIYDQLVDTGLNMNNVYFNTTNTIEDETYFSNNRIKLLNDTNGRNLFGISFDSLPIFENKEKKLVKTILK